VINQQDIIMAWKGEVNMECKSVKTEINGGKKTNGKCGGQAGRLTMCQKA